MRACPIPPRTGRGSHAIPPNSPARCATSTPTSRPASRWPNGKPAAAPEKHGAGAGHDDGRRESGPAVTIDAVGFVFDPNDPEPDYLKAFLDDEDDFFDGADMDEEEDEDEGIAVERAPRRASSGPREDAGPRSRTTSMALGAGRFVD